SAPSAPRPSTRPTTAYSTARASPSSGSSRPPCCPRDATRIPAFGSCPGSAWRRTTSSDRRPRGPLAPQKDRYTVHERHHRTPHRAVPHTPPRPAASTVRPDVVPVRVPPGAAGTGGLPVGARRPLLDPAPHGGRNLGAG